MKYLLGVIAILIVFGCTQHNHYRYAIKNKHPRLLLQDNDLARIRDYPAVDAGARQIRDIIIRYADSFLIREPIKYELDIRSTLLEKSREAIKIIVTESMAFFVTGDDRYRRKAIDELMNTASFPSWNPAHFLDVAEMTTAVSIGYDWLYDDLSPEQRKTISNAIYTKGILPYLEAHDSTRPYWVTLDNNWKLVCHGGLLAGAIAVADEYPEVTARVIDTCLSQLPAGFSRYAPDGCWYEGPGYWSYATYYSVLTIAVLQSGLNNDYGLSDAAGFSNTADTYLSMLSPSMQTFNFADDRFSRPVLNYTMLWLSKKFNKPCVSAAYCRLLFDSSYIGIQSPNFKYERFFALHLLFYEPVSSCSTNLPVAQWYKGMVDVLVFRGSDSLFFAMKGGDNSENHQHLDLGTFVVESQGVRWGCDLGSDQYHLPGFFNGAQGGLRWRYFRNTNFSHSTLVINDSLQRVMAKARVAGFDNSVQPFAILDLSEPYANVCKVFYRKAELLNEGILCLTDSITGLKPGSVIRWGMVTPALINIAGNCATLTSGTKSFYLKIADPTGAKFSVQSLKPLTMAEFQNSEYRMLSIVATKCSEDMKIVVMMTGSKDLLE